MGSKRLKAIRSDGTGGSRKWAKVANGGEKKVPVISSSGELVGKLIEHFCFLEDEDVESWHRGVVLKTFGRKKFLVRYDDCPDELYSQVLLEELKAGNVRVLELNGGGILLVRVFPICLKIMKLVRTFSGMQKLLTWTLIVIQ